MPHLPAMPTEYFSPRDTSAMTPTPEARSPASSPSEPRDRECHSHRDGHRDGHRDDGHRDDGHRDDGAAAFLPASPQKRKAEHEAGDDGGDGHHKGDNGDNADSADDGAGGSGSGDNSTSNGDDESNMGDGGGLGDRDGDDKENDTRSSSGGGGDSDEARDGPGPVAQLGGDLPAVPPCTFKDHATDKTVRTPKRASERLAEKESAAKRQKTQAVRREMPPRPMTHFAGLPGIEQPGTAAALEKVLQEFKNRQYDELQARIAALRPGDIEGYNRQIKTYLVHLARVERGEALVAAAEFLYWPSM